MSVRKSDPRLFVLSTIPIKSDQEIRRSKLPIHSDVLKSYIAFREELVMLQVLSPPQNVMQLIAQLWKF